jgi:hypothetical protein
MSASLRTAIAGAFRFTLVTLLTVVLLTTTMLLVAYPIAWLRGEEALSAPFVATGAVCALIFWLFVAAFHLRPETQLVPYAHRKQFILKMTSVLRDMGYILTAQRSNTLTYWPSFRSFLFGGGIQVVVGDQEAKLTGPKVSLDLFRRNFRLFNHLQRVQQYVDKPRKFTENILKRVELQLTLEPEQFEAVRTHVIKRLQKKGIVICELNILVQSDTGIEENLIECEIREWLEENAIGSEIRKDVIQFVEMIESDLANN